MGLRCAGKRNPIFFCSPSLSAPSFHVHEMLLQVGRDLPCEALQEQGTDLLSSSVPRGAQIPQGTAGPQSTNPAPRTR